MYGNDEITPWILDPQQSKTPQYGEKITFRTISEQVEVDNPVISMPGGAMKGGDAKDFLQGGAFGGGKPKGGDKAKGGKK